MDTVPVNVDAIIFWRVENAERAALAITNYRQAIERVAQSTLRETIGSSHLATLLSGPADGRCAVARRDRQSKTSEWGIAGAVGRNPRCRHSRRRCRTPCRVRRRPNARNRRG